MLNPIDTMALTAHVLEAIDAAVPNQKFNTPGAQDLVNLTIAQESQYYHLRQRGAGGTTSGPAVGLGQSEPETVRSVINDYAEYRPALLAAVQEVCSCDLSRMDDLDEEEYLKWQLMSNYMLTVAVIRMRYRWAKGPIPNREEGELLTDYIQRQFAYYKRGYNSLNGKATDKDFLMNAENWRRKGGKLAGER